MSLAGLSISASGKVQVSVKPGVSDNIKYADYIKISGKVSKPFNFNSKPNIYKNRFDFSLIFRRQDIYYVIHVSKADDIAILAQDSTYGFLKNINNISDKLNSLLFSYLPTVTATFYSAILLGRKESGYFLLNDIFAKSGTAHILAISGMNVGIIAFIIIFFLKAIGFKRRLRLIITILALILHCILTGMMSPVLRATIMAIFIIIGKLSEREVGVYNSLSLAAFLMLLFEPRYVFDIGFQLSFLAVLGIVSLSPVFIKILTHITKAQELADSNLLLYSLFRFIIFTFAVSFAAWLSVAPIIIYNFKIITPVALLANILIVPAVTFIQVVGTVFLISAMIFPVSALVFTSTAGMAVAILVNIAYFLSRIPGAYFYVGFDIPLVFILSYYCLLIFCIELLRRRLEVVRVDNTT